MYIVKDDRNILSSSYLKSLFKVIQFLPLISTRAQMDLHSIFD